MSGILDGREWFSWQMVDLVGRAYQKAFDKYSQLLAYESDATTSVWRSAALSLAYLKTELNRLADADSGAADPTLYRAGSDLFDRVDAALAPFKGDPEIGAAVARLPAATGVTPAGKLSPLLAVGMVAAVLVGYQLVKGK